jgi:hypothetical protein
MDRRGGGPIGTDTTKLFGGMFGGLLLVTGAVE